MPGDYRGDIPALLGAGVLEHTAAVQLATDYAPVELQVQRGTVTYDEERSPRVVADLDLVLDSVATYEALDPRLPAEVAVFAGYRHPIGWSSTGLLLAGIVVDRGALRPDNTVTVRVESAERVVIDAAASKAGTSVSLGSRVGAARRIVDLAFPTGRTWVDTTADATAATDPDLPNRDKWDVVTDLVDQAGCDIYDRGDGTWVVEYRVTDAGPSVHTLSTAGGTVIDSNVRTTRGEGYANRVQLIYEWTDTSDVRHRIAAIRDVTSGPFAAQAGRIVTYRETRDVPTTLTAARNAAASQVRRRVNRGQFTDVSGPSAYWIRPTDTVTLDLPAGGNADLIVSRVAYELGAGRMSLALRRAQRPEILARARALVEGEQDMTTDDSVRKIVREELRNALRVELTDFQREQIGTGMQAWPASKVLGYLGGQTAATRKFEQAAAAGDSAQAKVLADVAEDVQAIEASIAREEQ